MSALQIREAGREDLPALYELYRAALTLDTFSIDLLEEKLCRVPRPDQEVYQVFVAERDGALAGAMQSVMRKPVSKAWVGMFAVAGALRRQGIATALLEHVTGVWKAAGMKEAEALAIPGNYFLPGLDPRYTPALGFLERRGFERFRDCVNMIGDLVAPFDTSADEQRLAAKGVEVRRAAHDDGPLLDRFFETEFGEDWRLEAGLAMANDPPAMHLAVKGDRIIAFSAHSTQNKEWGFFGPMGTLPETRGLGIGGVLLLRCLNDMREAGHKTTVIPWVGPIAFYSHYANCRVERVFWRYRRSL